jgi:predicted DNA-binding protein (MmcQ/YjbR family)
MTADEFNQYCESFTASTYVNQWNNSHVWKVGGKVFALAKLHGKPLDGISFKASELNFHFLKEQAHFRGAPYMATRGMKWIQFYDFANLTDELLLKHEDDMRYYLAESYKLVAAGLSKKLRNELGIEIPPTTKI